jgi:3-hydroxyisobutyrate dehydrogenase-like beta-hydroxyacid dehydrogenase
MKIGFLGLGKMGTAIAKHLQKAGHELTVWNRTAAATAPLAEVGAKVAATPGEAFAGAEVIFSMLMDDAAVEGLILGNDVAVLKSMEAGTIHVSLSTISVKLSQRLTKEHEDRSQHFVGAPVFGRPNVAEDGKLWTVVGGAEQAVAKILPLLESFSRGITVASDKPWSAHALKISGNFLITAMIESLSEALVFAKAEGIDPALFLETVNNALFQSPFYAAYSKIMLNPPAKPGGTIALGAKDTRLFREAAVEAGVRTPLADGFAEDFRRASEVGMDQADWAAGLYELARKTKLKENAPHV